MEPRNTADIIKVIRTILTSAKNGLLTQEINDDYEQMEGKQIPFNALGYNTLEDWLRDTNQFAFIDTKHGVKVMSKPSKDAYVNRSAPNSPSKGKKKGNMMIPPQRALRPTTDNHWSGTAYSQAYTQMPNRSVKKAFTYPVKPQTVYSNGGTYRPILKQSNIKQVPKDETPNFTTDEATNWNCSVVQARPFPMRSQCSHQNSTWMNRNNSNDRMLKKPNDVPLAKSSVQSRLAIQKNISADTVDHVQIQQIQQTQQTQLTHENVDTSFEYSNGGIVQKVSYSFCHSLHCALWIRSNPIFIANNRKEKKFNSRIKRNGEKWK